MRAIWFSVLLTMVCLSPAFTQVAIGTNPNSPPTPAANAVLLLVGDGKQGLVIPSGDRNTVTGPTKGMLLYDSNQNQVFFYNGTEWKSVAGGGGAQEIQINGNVITLKSSSGDTFFALASTAPTSNGQLLTWNGTAWTSTAAGPIADGNVLTWNGASSQWVSKAPSVPNPTLGGDLSGTTTAATVARIQGQTVATTAPATGQVLQFVGGQWSPQNLTGGGTVTAVSVSSANGFTGTVATPSTTPTITVGTSVTGMLKGNGTALSAATAGTDYLTPTGSGSGLTNLNASNITSGTVANARLNVGTAANQLVQLDGTGRLPAVDGSQLTNLPLGSVADGTITGGPAGAGVKIAANTITDANISTTAAIAGSKINPSFGAQNITTTTGSASIGGGLNVGLSNGLQISNSGNFTRINNIATSFPAAQGAANTYLRNDGAGNLSWATVAGGSDVTAQNGVLTGNGSTITGVASLPVNLGGTGATSLSGLVVGNGTSAMTAIATGTNGQVLTVTAGVPSWQNASGLTNPMTSAGDLIYGGAGGTPTRLVTGTGFLKGGATPTYSAVGLASTDVTGVLPIANGGTGAATAPLARTSLGLGSLATLSAVSSTEITDGTITDADISGTAAIAGSKITPNFGAQNVVTTGTLTTGTAAAFAVDATGNITKIRNVTLSFPAANAAGVLTNNGTGTLSWGSTLTNPMTTANDLIVGGAGGAATRLAAPGNNQLLTSNASGVVSWVPQTTFMTNPLTANGDIIYAVGSTPTRLAAGTGFLKGGAVPSYSAVNLNSSDVTGSLPVTSGGTGITTFGTGGLLFASGATSMGTISNGTAGQILLVTGTTPTWQSMSGDATLTGAGAMTIANNAITDAKVSTTAAIAGTKILPNFGTQAVTSGAITATSSATTISATTSTNSINQYAISGTTTGTGDAAGFFLVNNPSNSFPAVYGETRGNGAGVFGSVGATGTGSAGIFTNLNSANNNPIVRILASAGTGSSLKAEGVIETVGFKVTGGVPGAGKVLTSDASGNATWQAGGGSGWSLTGNAGTNPTTNYFGTSDAQPLRVATGGTERMRFDNLGNIGVGTTLPGARFHIKQSAQVNDVPVDVGDGFFGAGLMFENNGTTDAYYMGYGRGGGFRLGHRSVSNVYNNILYINAGGGQVALGNTPPSEKLNVEGGIKFSGALMPNNLAGTAGQVLTSAGPGAPPTWAPAAGGATPASTVIRGNDVGTAQVASSIFDNGFYTGIGRTTAIGNSRFDINATGFGAGNYGGMYIQTDNTGFPFYGYSNNGGTSMWTYWNGGTGTWHVWNGGSERLSVDNLGNVGIGITAPNFKLHIIDDKPSSYITKIENLNGSPTADGLGILLNNTTGANDYLFFERSGGSVQGRISASGSGAVQYLTSSDLRLKAGVTDYNGGLEAVLKMRPRNYVFKSSPDVPRVGFIAQELIKVFPEAVNGVENGNPETEPMMVDYSKLTPVLVKAIQEQQKLIDELKEKNAELEKLLRDSKYKVESLMTLKAELDEIKRVLGLEAKNK